MTGHPRHSSSRRLSLTGIVTRGRHRTEPRRRRLAALRRLGPVVLSAVGIVLGTGTMAAAYLALTYNGTGASHAGAIGAASSFAAASSSPNQATLSWTPPAGAAPTGYRLVQSPGSVAGTCAALTASSHGCTAGGLSPGTQYTWTLAATYASWSSTAVGATAKTVTPAVALAPTAGSAGTMVGVAGSGFAASSPLTFAFAPSGGSPGALALAGCTPTTTGAGALPAPPCQVTIPATAATGGGTVTVTDAAGNTASATFAVTAPGGLGAMAVAPASVIGGSTGNTLTFTYQATGGALALGEVDLSVASWVAAGGTAPQTQSASAAGYTVASTGSVAYTAANGTIEVTAVTLPANGTLTVTFGSGGGASGVTAPVPGGTSVPYSFTAKEASTAAGALAALTTSPQVTVVKTVAAACGSPVLFTLPAHATVPFTAVGAGGGAGGAPAGGAGGAGGAGATVSGTLANTTGTAIQLSVEPGCPGGSGSAAPADNGGGSGYAGGGAGGQGQASGEAGGGGGGTTSIQIAGSGTYLVVAAGGGGGGGGGGGTSPGGSQPGAPGGGATATSTSAVAANGSAGLSATTTGSSAGAGAGAGGGGGGGGGVGTAAAGGTASPDAPGGGGAGGASYPAGPVTAGGITVGGLSYGAGTPGAAGSASVG